MPNAAVTLDEVSKRRDAWFKYFIWWKRLSWALSVLTVIVSAFVASSLSKDFYREGFALFVAFCTGLQATLKPGNRVDAYREAWVVLDLALKKFSGAPTEIIDALRSGEARIGEGRAGETKPAPAVSDP